ncbi:MAG: acetate--CoA ligase family protein [Desulfobacterota bacterium]|jgi:acetyl-CoA synthetase (ADP-forming)|nr:acetate--CoA ligase family protein [Thermodesulfobacteriota bacterium]
MNWIEQAQARGSASLTEFESKQVLSRYGIPVTREREVFTPEAALQAAEEIGYPVALKGAGAGLLHKTDAGLVHLNLNDAEEVGQAYGAVTGDPAVSGVLVQEMISGQRELVAGLTRDPQFGPCAMFGLGGIFTEILQDVVFRVAPLSRWDARQMMEDLRGREILGGLRGMPPVDREALADILIALGRIGLENVAVREIDVNPLIIQRDGRPVAVDALIVLV